MVVARRAVAVGQERVARPLNAHFNQGKAVFLLAEPRQRLSCNWLDASTVIRDESVVNGGVLHTVGAEPNWEPFEVSTKV